MVASPNVGYFLRLEGSNVSTLFNVHLLWIYFVAGGSHTMSYFIVLCVYTTYFHPDILCK